MIWEELTVYGKLEEEELKPAFRDLTKMLGQSLKEYRFVKKGRKLFRLSHDLLEVIDFDYRGHWAGQSEYFHTNIGLIPICWPGLTQEYYLIASKEIKEIDKSIKDHYRISKEYPLLADYLTRRIIKFVLPFFDTYNSTAKIVEKSGDFKYKTRCGGTDIKKSNLLILFSELKQHKSQKSVKIIDSEIEFLNHLKINTPIPEAQFELKTKLEIWGNLKSKVIAKNWLELDSLFSQTENEELSRLKIKPFVNNTD